MPTTINELPPVSLRRGLQTIRALVILHPGLFGTAVGGAASFAIATVASSYALGQVTDRIIVPRFSE